MPPAPKRKRRVPKLCYTAARGIGFYATYRDPTTALPRKHIFGDIDRASAELAYAEWLAAYLRHDPVAVAPQRRRAKPAPADPPRVLPEAEVDPQSILAVADDFLTSVVDARTRAANAAGHDRRQASIAPNTAAAQHRQVRDFLIFLNSRHGHGAVGQMTVRDLTMADVEAYNRWLTSDRGLSSSEVLKRMQIVKRLANRAGRPEHGGQVLSWNWDSRDKSYGTPKQQRRLPTLKQLQAILRESELRERAIVWLAIGLGMGQSDLAAIHVGQIDRRGYDLRRGKTGIDRYGSTPPLVWTYVDALTRSADRKPGELLFVTRNGRPMVHGGTNAISLWWSKLRTRLGETKDTLDGFYVMRHLGATERGSREGTSIGEMKRWLGHSASSQIADHYMKPVAPEHRAVVSWVRKQLSSSSITLPK